MLLVDVGASIVRPAIKVDTEEGIGEQRRRVPCINRQRFDVEVAELQRLDHPPERTGRARVVLPTELRRRRERRNGHRTQRPERWQRLRERDDIKVSPEHICLREVRLVACE